MRKTLQQVAIFVLCGSMAIFTGCGDGTPEDFGSDPNHNATHQTPPTTSDLAPASIGGKTITGHIGGTNTVFQIVTSGTTSGTYTYSENGNHLNDGTYTWMKTSDDTGVLTLAPDNHTLELDYQAPRQGTYVFHATSYTETGTFSTN